MRDDKNYPGYSLNIASLFRPGPFRLPKLPTGADSAKDTYLIKHFFMLQCYRALDSNTRTMPWIILSNARARGGGGGWYCHRCAIWVCAAVTGLVFKQFTLGEGI